MVVKPPPDLSSMIFKREPHLGHRNHDDSPTHTNSNHFIHAGVEVGDVFKNLKGSYEWKELNRKFNLCRGHQQDPEVGFAIDMRAEILQPFFFHIYTDHLVKAWSDKFGNETVPTPHVQVSLAFR